MKKTDSKAGSRRIFFEDLNSIRELVRILFLYGCYTGNDLVEKELFSVIHANDKMEHYHFGKRKLDTEKKRLTAIYPPDFLNKRKKERQVILNINPDIYDQQDDTLLRLFRYCAFRDTEIFMFFTLMQCLQVKEENEGTDEDGFSIKNIANDIYEYDEWRNLPDYYYLKNKLLRVEKEYSENPEKLETALANWVRPHLEKLVDAGYVEQTSYIEIKEMTDYSQQVELYHYKLADNTLQAMIEKHTDDNVINSLYALLRFLAKTEPLAVPYYLASNKLKLAIMACGDEYPSPAILYRHNHMYNVLDNEVLLDLLKVIHKQGTAHIVYKKMTNVIYENDTSYQKAEMRAFPIECRHDFTTGRQYAAVVNLETGKKESLRLDQIITVEEENTDISDKRKIIETAKKEDYSWTSSMKNVGEKHRVEIEFSYRDIGSKLDPARFRLMKEKENGQIRKTEKGRDLLIIEVSDPMELVPWIRTYGATAKVLKSEDAEVEKMRKHMIASWKEALEQYGTV